MRVLTGSLFAAILAGCGSGKEPAPVAALRVDHVTVCVPALDPAREAFAAAGIETEYGGPHANGISEMALSAFPDGSYLELIAPRAGVDAAPHYWGDFMTRQAGPCGWAMTTLDLDADAQRLTAAGIAIDRQKGGRERPDGKQLRWQTATVGPPPQGSFFPFLIFDETDRALRAYPQGHPTTIDFAGVRFAVVAVRDLEDAIGLYRRAFELSEPRTQDDATLGAHLAWFEGTPIVLASPASSEGWLAERLAAFGEIPCAFVLAAPQPVANPDALWFDWSIRWLDTGGMRIGITTEN